MSIAEKTQAPLPSTAYTKPYMPTGFTRVPGTTLDSGLAIQDGDGNQYVWVEVPKNNTVYSEATLALDLDTLSGTALDAAYTTIENELHTYTSFYRNGTSNKDEFPSNESVKEATGIESLVEYNQLKQKMLNSVFENGGFYVGRYETGIENSFRGYNESATVIPKEIPVIKRNVYPYTSVTCSQVQTLSSNMESGEYTSSLMFGVQRDLVLKYLETKAVEKGTDILTIQSELNTDSTNWGNYYNNLYNIINSHSKFSTYHGAFWFSSVYGEKKAKINKLLSTEASSTFCKQGIYDFAGNVFEFTLEYGTYIVGVNRGRQFQWSVAEVDRRVAVILNGKLEPNTGFRISIF